MLGASTVASAQESPEDTIREAREAREESRRERAELAGELDILEAEEEELLAALMAINEQVEAQELRVAEARAELDRLRDHIGGLNDQIILTRQHSEFVRQQSVERVVRAYMQPDEPLSSSLLTSGDLHDGTRRQTLFRFATLSDVDLRDELRAIDDDLVDLEAEASRQEIAAAG